MGMKAREGEVVNDDDDKIPTQRCTTNDDDAAECIMRSAVVEPFKPKKSSPPKTLFA